MLEYARSIPVLTLGLAIAPYLLSSPIQSVKIILKVHKSKQLLVQQLLLGTGTCKTIAGTPEEVNRMKDLKGHTTKAMAFCIYSDDDPTLGMAVPPALTDFMGQFPDAAANVLWALDFNHEKFNLHKVRFMINMVSKEGKAVDYTPTSERLFEDHEANAMM